MLDIAEKKNISNNKRLKLEEAFLLGTLPGPLYLLSLLPFPIVLDRPDLPRSPFVKPAALTLPQSCAVSWPHYHQLSKKLHPPKQQRNRVIECFLAL